MFKGVYAKFRRARVRHSGHLAPPTRQGDKATASHHERGQARTCGGAGDGHAVEHNLYAGWATMASVFWTGDQREHFFGHGI